MQTTLRLDCIGPPLLCCIIWATQCCPQLAHGADSVAVTQSLTPEPAALHDEESPLCGTWLVKQGATRNYSSHRTQFSLRLDPTKQAHGRLPQTVVAGEWSAVVSDSDKRVLDLHANGKLVGEAQLEEDGDSITIRMRSNGSEVVLSRISKWQGRVLGNLPDGKWEETRIKQGGVIKEVTFADGRLNGVCKEYFDDGQLRSQSYYKQGRRHGIERCWRRDKSKLSEVSYVDGQLHGPTVVFDAGDNILGKLLYRDDLPWSGRYIALDVSGSSVLEAGCYANGARTGDWFVFDRDGNVVEHHKH